MQIGPQDGFEPPREGKHVAALPLCDLGDDVSGGAEAVEAEPPSFAGNSQRAPPDQPRAQQRRSRDIITVAASVLGPADAHT
jgi:hypothetical protein